MSDIKQINESEEYKRYSARKDRREQWLKQSVFYKMPGLKQMLHWWIDQEGWYVTAHFWSGLTQPFRNVWYFLQNLWAYAPILWQDRDWDHGYIIILLHKKIQRTKECIKKNQNHVDWEQDVAELQEAEDRLKYLIEDDFEFNTKPINGYFRREQAAYLETFQYIGQCIRRWWD